MTALHLPPTTQTNPLNHTIELASDGDTRAQHQLIEHIMPRITNSLTYLVSNLTDRDDILQIVLIEVLKSLHTYKGEGFYAWVDRITVRTAMRQIKKNRWWQFRFKQDEANQLADWSPCNHNQRILLRQHLATALQKLSMERRTAILLKHVHGYSIAEIAEMTDTLENTVRGRLRTGKKQLRAIVARDPELRQWCEGFAAMMEDSP